MKQLLLVLKVIVSNWKKAKGQFIFTILGIAIATTLWSSIDIINKQTIKAQKRSIDLLQSSFRPIIIDREKPYVSQADYTKLRLQGWIVNPVIKANLKNLNIGDSVNLEADALIKYVEKLLQFNNKEQKLSPLDEISSVWLKENGWSK